MPLNFPFVLGEFGEFSFSPLLGLLNQRKEEKLLRFRSKHKLHNLPSQPPQGCQMSDLPDRKLKICPRENVCPRDLWSNCPNLNQNLSENQCSKQNLLLSKSSKTVRIETQIWPNDLKNAWQPWTQTRLSSKARLKLDSRKCGLNPLA